MLVKSDHLINFWAENHKRYTKVATNLDMDTFDKNLGFRAHWTSELIAIHIGGCLAVSGSMDTWRAVTSINSGILISGVYETIPTIKWCSCYIPYKNPKQPGDDFHCSVSLTCGTNSDESHGCAASAQ